MNSAATPETLAELLQKKVRGEVRADLAARERYSTDASIYEIEPLVIVQPKDEDDVGAVLKFASEQKVPVVARGAGTGLAGESLGRAIILDCTVHMTRVLELDEKHRTVTVECGVVLDNLNAELAKKGYRFTVDPSSSARCTVGGVIANNASGAHSLRFGDTRTNLVAARVCFIDGSVTVAQPVKMSSADFEQKKNAPGIAGKIHRELPELVKKNAAVIAAKKCKAERDRSGYQLRGVLDGEIFDLSRVICGCEGTLGIVTKAVLKVEPLPKCTGTAALFFASVLDATAGVPAIRATNPVCCELLDKTLIELGREAVPELSPLLPTDARAMLLIEYEGRDEAEVKQALDVLKQLFPSPLVGEGRVRALTDEKAQDQMWAVRDSATPLLYRRTDGLRPIPIVEDGAVPIEKLAEYVARAGTVFEKYKLPWSAYAHAGHGEVHLRPMMDLNRREHVEILEPMASEVHAIVWELGGTISGEHAEGLVRTQFVPKQAGAELYEVFKQVKKLFDPEGLLNPDKKISGDEHLMLKNLRRKPYTVDVPPVNRRQVKPPSN
ncbi:MAG TPA: FAD-binding oxidoreductase [Planctomycetota bacterium]|nr:FAD-binding oxidoreductase [Planctomycetota bacterium]